MSYDVVEDLQHATNSIDFNTGNLCIHYGTNLGSAETIDRVNYLTAPVLSDPSPHILI